LDGSTGELAVRQRDTVLLGHAAEHRERVVADLVAQAARAGMDHDADHVLLEPIDPGYVGVKDMIDDLDLEEVISGAQGTALFRAASEGVVADAIRLRLRDASLGLGVYNVRRVAEVSAQQEARALAHQPAQLALVELVSARAANSGRHVAEKLLNE